MTTPKEILINNARYVLVEVKNHILDINYKLEIYPTNLPVMTYLEAVKYVKNIVDDWRIPTLEELKIMYKNKDTIGGFITTASGSGYPDWYWSSTEPRDFPSHVWFVRFSDGYEDWHLKDNFRLSCRPVRSVPVTG